MPQISRDAERVETFEQRILGVLRQRGDLPTAVCNSARGPFVSGDRFPGLIQALLAVRHGPCRVPFVQERFTPFDQLIVDLTDDLCTQRVVAPVGQRKPSAQGGFIAFHNGVDP